MDTQIPSKSQWSNTRVCRVYTLVSEYTEAELQFRQAKRRLNRFCVFAKISYNEIRAKARKPAVWLEMRAKSKRFEIVKASFLAHIAKRHVQGKTVETPPPQRKEEKHFPLSPASTIIVPTVQNDSVLLNSYNELRVSYDHSRVFVSRLDNLVLTLNSEVSKLKAELAAQKARLIKSEKQCAELKKSITLTNLDLGGSHIGISLYGTPSISPRNNSEAEGKERSDFFPGEELSSSGKIDFSWERADIGVREPEERLTSPRAL